ncbi:hypothetical protein AGOR_G00248260 [Albula goreensis]|uniref:Exportin-T n=1 Tax=Albula goreensis TaxID=1534307 RepID=A0A8T3CFX1_9TELE|nr:hypothetical protein AGOR_G00248260 [Albula goreensis]
MDEHALLGLNPNADATYRQRALVYFEQLKESQDAWQVCAEALAKGLYSDDHVKFSASKFWNIKSSSDMQNSVQYSSSLSEKP